MGISQILRNFSYYKKQIDFFFIKVLLILHYFMSIFYNFSIQRMLYR